MAGMALILSMVCLNSTCIKDTNKISYELIANRANPELSRQLKEAQLKAIANQINGKVLSITTLEDPPLSWTEKENGTTVIKGVVGGILDLLMKKFNFTYEVKLPKRNIIGSSSDIDGSILEILKNGVRKLFVWNFRCPITDLSLYLNQGRGIRSCLSADFR